MATLDVKDDGLQALSEAEMEIVAEHKHKHEEAGDVDPDAGEYLDEIYDMVDAVVPRTDDPTVPVVTFRAWFLGMVFCLLMAFVNALFQFRTNTFQVNAFMGTLLAFPLGHFLAATLPTHKFNMGPLGTFTLNPGPFNYKEHTLIYVFCNTAVQPAYALYNIIGQRYGLHQQNLTVIACVGFVVVTQCFGYGLAGLCRRYLVRPAAMLWPINLSTIALLNSLHQKDDDGKYKMTRYKFFWIVTACMAIYEWFPLYMAPFLVGISFLCFGSPVGSKIRVMGSGRNGMGFLSFSFDWSILTILTPITTPLWALINQFGGFWLTFWIVVPLLWTNDAFGIDSKLGTDPVYGPNGTGDFPLGYGLNTRALFDKDGTPLSAKSFVNRSDLSFKATYYEAHRPIYISTYFAMSYTASFIVFTAALVHVTLWYGKDIWNRFRSAMRDLDSNDIHARLMDTYPEVPEWWYIGILIFNLVLAIVVCQWGGFDLPWWGVILGLALAIVSILPIGIIQAISGQQIGLNVMSEFMIGLILPGRIAAVMAFKTLSYMAMTQGLLLVQDLKLGHYMKIPPRAMFSAQLVATIGAAIVNLFTSFWIYESFGKASAKPENLIDKNNPDLGYEWKLATGEAPLGWTANGFGVFLNAGAIWGAIGPARFFGPGSPYVKTLWGFLLGALLPIVPWFLHQQFPNGYWHLVNIPVIAAFPLDPGMNLSLLITPVIIGFVVNYVLKKYRHDWWKKYAYVMSAAFDCGLAIATVTTFFFSQYDANFLIPFPNYIFNRGDPELCAPDYFMTCTEHATQGNAFGKTYNISLDGYCSGIDFGGLAA
ncbi:hypothetical protein HDU76_010693 [Blyttiomyces sp. JEL0837]|nr:hypothetical protein HDU76_010693 [Blyttiomyces sp. JEL0837]